MERIKKMEVDLEREISFIINTKVKDPRVGFVTITDVELSSDYHWINVFISVMGDDEKIHDSIQGLNQCRGFIKKNLKKRIKLRIIPEINFVYDRAIDRGLRITKIIETLNKNKNCQ